MSFVRVNTGEVEVGQPVPWALYDDRKQLLFARGVIVETESQKKALIEWAFSANWRSAKPA